MNAAPASSGLTFERALPIFALTFVDVLGLTIILPLLHLYAAAFGATPLEVLLTAAAFPLAQLIGVPVMGALSDRFGRKPLLIVSQITTCIGFVWLGLAGSLAMVIASRLFDGLFGANLATAQAAMADITDDSTRAQGLGVTGAAFGVGFLFGPAIALGTLQVTDSLALPAFIAAGYSFISILLTVFWFRETLPPEKRGGGGAASARSPFAALRWLRDSRVRGLLFLVFVQQIVFFAFESMLGLYTLNRAGMLGMGNTVLFLWAGVVLVGVQARGIGALARKWGERRLALFALAMLALGLLILAATPQQPHPLYLRQVALNDLAGHAPDATESVIGRIQVPLPSDDGRGILGVLWLFVGVVPVAVGAGLIRPALNTLLTKQVGGEYGSVLGASSATVSAANAAAPLLAGLAFQSYGPTAPFWIGGAAMLGVLLLAHVVLRSHVLHPSPDSAT
jgi:MFS transporter, DHA1 family, tetracycline resistance protein